jgi:acetyl-CoA C-acetyltransferase
VGAFGGSLRDVSAAQLGTAVVRELIARTQVQTTLVDDCVFAQSYPNGEAPAIGRVVALDAGLPTSVPGLQIDRRCGSGLQALAYAAMCVQTGAADDEIVPVATGSSRGQTIVDRDERPRPDTNLEALAALRPIMLAQDLEAAVTARMEAR